jgi:hypothetical protein
MPKKEVTVAADADLLAQLSAAYPQEAGVNRLMLPRLTFKSQDVFEGKGKDKKVTVEAGTFFTERPTEEKNEEGKNVWDKTELGLEIEGLIAYRRKQLRYYDEPNDTYYSTPVYDDVNDVIPLFKGKDKHATGTTAELKKLFEYVDSESGKTRSRLEDNVVLYIIYQDELYQMGLRGSSMYSFKDYERKASPSVSAVLTHFSSQAQEKGSIQWNQMTFKAVRTITTEEAHIVIDAQNKIRDAVEAEKAYYASLQQSEVVAAALYEGHASAAALPAGDDDWTTLPTASDK